MTEAGIDAVPHAHPQLETWRNNFKGVRTLHERTNLELFGAIDDLWRDLPAFDSRLEFTIRLLPYVGDDGWVEETLRDVRAVLTAPGPPQPGAECEFCEFVARASRKLQ